jgi:gliding motility-associated-like protein
MTGVNDKWKILGIRTDFNNASEIYIFDKHGKLLKQLDPITDGWDGTYLGKPMPATDYWFRVYLSEDEREFKGHFSLIRGKY